MSKFATKEDHLRALFDLVDKDKSGKIDPEEYYSLLKQCNPAISFDEQKSSFNKVDKDKSNKVDREEFVKHFLELFKADSDEVFGKRVASASKFMTRKPVLIDLFGRFDTDKNGFLSRGEIYRMLKITKPDVKNEDVTEFIKLVDVDHDKKVQPEEFINYFFEHTKADTDVEFAKRVQLTNWGRRKCKLLEVFSAYDKDGNGTLDVNEFASMMKLNGRKFIEPEKILDFLLSIDKDKNRAIDFGEWSTYMAGLTFEWDDEQFNLAIRNMLEAAIGATKGKESKK